MKYERDISVSRGRGGLTSVINHPYDTSSTYNEHRRLNPGRCNKAPTGAIPFTRIPSGRSSCASVDVACAMADLEYMYGNEFPLVAGSYVLIV